MRHSGRCGLRDTTHRRRRQEANTLRRARGAAHGTVSHSSFHVKNRPTVCALVDQSIDIFVDEISRQKSTLNAASLVQDFHIIGQLCEFWRKLKFCEAKNNVT
jgi:hypothetical protein